jgi:hypothetical protein
MAIFRESNTIVVPQDPAIVKNLVTKQMVIPPGEQIIRENSTGNTLIPTNIVNSDGQEVLANTVVTEQNSNVYVTNININEDQNFITNIEGGGATLCVGTVDSSNVYTNITTNVNKLGFDTDSGFDVTDLGGGLAKIGMNSTFKCWEVNGSSGLIACGLDTVNFVAGSNITITSDNTAVPKTLTINSTGGGGVSLDAYCSLAIGGGLTNSIGYDNIAIGYNAMYCNTTGYGNIAIGRCSLGCNEWGFNNIAFGACTGTRSINNQLWSSVAIGVGAGLGGTNNVAIGSCAGINECTGNWVNNGVYIGGNAGRNVGNEGANVMIGNNAGRNTVPSCNCFTLFNGNNVAIGNNSGRSTHGSGNISIGDCAGNGAGYGGYGCSFIKSFGNIIIGQRAGTGFSTCDYSSSSSYWNVVIGHEAACCCNVVSQSENVYIGRRAGICRPTSGNIHIGGGDCIPSVICNCTTVGCNLQMVTGRLGTTQTRILANKYGMFVNPGTSDSEHKHVVSGGNWNLASVAVNYLITQGYVELPLNNGSLFYIFRPANDFEVRITGNFTWKYTGSPYATPKYTEIRVVIKQDPSALTPKIINAVSIKTDSMNSHELQQLRWVNNVIPSGTPSGTDIIILTLYDLSTSGVTGYQNTYFVTAELKSYAMAP